MAVCGCGRDGDLLASHYVVPLSRLALVRFRLACGSGFHFPARLASPVCRRVLFVCVGARHLFAHVFPCPVRFLRRACFPPCLISRVRSARRSLPACPRLDDSVWVGWSSHWCGSLLRPVGVGLPPLVAPASRIPSRRASSFPAPIVGLLASPISVSCGFPCGLPRFALLPVLLVVGRGGLLCRCSLSSRAARCLEFRFSVSLVPRG